MAGAAELNIRLIGTDLASAAFKSATASLGGLKNAVTAPIRGIGALQSGLQNAAQSAAVTGGLLTGAVTAPIAAGFGAAIKKVIDLETNLNVLQAVTGASAAQMAIASKRAIELGADITLPGVTAAKATEAMLELGKAGLSFDQILAATRGTLQLATAGQLGFAEAATITGRALNAFNLPGEQASRVADLMAAAANASAVEVRDMALAFQQGSAAAAISKIPIEEFTAAIALLGNAGIVGSDAGTSLKTFFLGLTNRTKKSVEALEVLGISFIDVKGNIKPLPTIVNDLNRSLAKLPTARKTQVLKDIFGTDAFRAAAVLSDAGAKGFADMLAAVTKVGAANDLASARTKGLAGALENLNNAWEALTTTALLPILPVLTKIVTLGSDLITAFGNLSPATRGMIAAFVGVFAAAGPVLLLLGGLAAAAAFLLTPFGAIVAALALYAGSQAKAAGGLGAFVPGIESLAVALSHVLKGNASPRVLADELKRSFGIDVAGFLSKWSDGFNRLFPFILQAWTAFKLFNGYVQDSVLPNLQRLAEWFAAGILPRLQAFAGFLDSTVLPALGRFADFVGALVVPKLKEFGAWLETDGKPLIELFAQLIGVTLLGKLVELGTWLMTDGPAALKAFGDWFKGDGVEGIRAFSALITTVGDTISAIVGPAFKTLADNAGAIFRELAPLAEAFSGLLIVLKPVADFLGMVFAGIAASIPGLIRQLTGFITVLTGGIQLVQALFTGLAEAQVALARGDLAGVGAALQKAWTGAVAAMQTANEGQQKIAQGAAMAMQAQAGVAQGTVPATAVPIGPQPVPGAAGFVGPGMLTPTELAAARAALSEFTQQTREASTNVAGWNQVMKNAPADMQTVMAWYLSQV